MSATERIERCRTDLVERGWAGLLATPGVNFAHLTGAVLERTERLTCLGLPADGDPWVVCPAFETERLGEAIPGATLLPWEEDEDPFRAVAERIGAAGGGTWAVEPTTAYHDAARLAEAAGDVRLVDGAPVFERVRRAKDAGEIARLRAAVGAAWAVFDEVLPTLEPGMTEAALLERILAAFAARGYDGWALVQFGPGAAVPHGEAGDRPLEAGQVVLIDWGGWRDGFGADLTRTFWWDGGVVSGESAPEEFREILGIVRAAQAAGLEAMAPGVACGAVDEAARAVIRDAGYGERFTHRLGHGLGREIHEPPYLVSGSEDPLRIGDVVTVEPGIYLPGRFGVRWEDDVRLIEGGIEILSRREDGAW